jgi:hypothetical protein
MRIRFHGKSRDPALVDGYGLEEGMAAKERKKGSG